MPRGQTPLLTLQHAANGIRRDHMDPPSAEEKFKAVAHARDVLLNKKKRQLYDEFGEIGLKEGFNPDAFRQYRTGAPGGR